MNAVCVGDAHARTSNTGGAEGRAALEIGRRASVAVDPGSARFLVSRSSHLPHVVAAELANFVLSPEHPKEQALLCANGFRDTTRIASGSPEMWRDIALANRENLCRALGSIR